MQTLSETSKRIYPATLQTVVDDTPQNVSCNSRLARSSPPSLINSSSHRFAVNNFLHALYFTTSKSTSHRRKKSEASLNVHPPPKRKSDIQKSVDAEEIEFDIIRR